MAQQFSLAEKASPQVAVIGAGGMGLLYGGMLSSCADVSIVARSQERREAINAHGVILEDGGNTLCFNSVKAVEHLGEAPAPDLVIVVVKGPDTAEAIAAAAPHIPPAASVLTLQNGLGNVEAIVAHVPEEQVLAGSCYNGVSLLGPGRARIAGRGETRLGELAGGLSPRLLALVQLFERSGLKASISENIQGVVWSKVLVNAGINPLAALTRLKNGELAALPEARALMSVLVAEGAALSERLGIKLDEPDPVAHALRVAHSTGSNHASMLQDILQGKKTEIDSINGFLVSKGHDLGFDLPLNRAITMLVRLLERSRAE